MRTQTVKILRAFFWNNRALKVGEVVELPYSLAMESKASGRGEFVTEEVKAPVAETKPAPTAVPAPDVPGTRRPHA